MPIIGVIDSSKSGNLYAASYDSLAAFVTGGNNSVNFSSIPQTYQHLQLRISYRSQSASPDDTYFIRFNGTNTNYYGGHYFRATGASVAAQANPFSRTDLITGVYCSTNTATTNVFTTVVIDILDYANTNKFKVVRQFGGFDNNGDGTVTLASAFWKSLNAINTLSVTGYATGPNANTTVALYGIKGM